MQRRQTALRMRVADRQPERVGGVRAGLAGQGQQPHHHFLNLRLAGATVADDGFFQLQRGVLDHRQPLRHQRGYGRAARLPQQQGGLRVDVDEHDLHHRDLGASLPRHLAHAVEQRLQTLGQRALRDTDGAAGLIAQTLALGIDHAVARGVESGVDTEDAHAPRFRGCE